MREAVTALLFFGFLIAFAIVIGFTVSFIDYSIRPYEYDTKLDTVQISHQTEWDGSLHRNKDLTWMIYHRLMPLKDGTVIDFGSLGVWQVNKVWKNNGIHTHFCRRVELKVVNYPGNNSSEDTDEVTE